MYLRGIHGDEFGLSNCFKVLRFESFVLRVSKCHVVVHGLRPWKTWFSDGVMWVVHVLFPWTTLLLRLVWIVHVLCTWTMLLLCRWVSLPCALPMDEPTAQTTNKNNWLKITDDPYGRIWVVIFLLSHQNIFRKCYFRERKIFSSVWFALWKLF